MNMRTTLMLLAATVAGPVTAETPAEYYTALAAPAATTTTATPEQRAEAMAALAYLPADCEYALSITDIPALLATLHRTGSVQEEALNFILPKEYKLIRSVAVGGGKNNAEMLFALCSLYGNYSSNSYYAAMRGIIYAASEQYRSTLEQVLNNAVTDNLQQAKATIAATKLAPSYGVVVLTPDNQTTVQEWYAALTEEMQKEAAGDEKIEYVCINGFSGLKFTTPINPPADFDDHFTAVLKEELSKRSFYVMLRTEGDALIAAICEDPTQLTIAATPQDSILGTDKLSTADAMLNNGLFLVSYADPRIMQGVTTLGNTAISNVINTANNMFNTMAAKGDANQSTFTKAAQATQAIAQAWAKINDEQHEQPLCAAVAWNDSAIDIDITYDNFGYTYSPAKLRLMDKAADANTIYYAESAYPASTRWPKLTDMVDAALAVTEGCIAAMPADQQGSLSVKLATFKHFLPELNDGINAFSTMLSGLDNSFALVIDKGATMPAILGGAPGNTTSFPRVALYSGVKDRAKLSEGWDALLATGAATLKKAGQNPTYINMLPILPKAVGNGMSYSISMPWFSKDLIPTLAVNDTTFVMGSSETLNAEIMKSATGTVDFPGMVCTIKFAPLADMLQDIADDLTARAEAEMMATVPTDPKAEPVVTMVADADDTEEPIIVNIDDDFSDDEAYYEEEEEDEFEDYIISAETAPSPAARRAETAETAAMVAKTIASIFESFNLVSTADADTARIRIQLKFKK